MEASSASPDPLSLVEAVLRHGVTPAMLRGVTQEELDALYQVVYDNVLDLRWDEAVEDAARLAQLDPGEPRYLFAFALCLQHLGQHESAARFYAQALVLKATDAVCAFRLGECMVALDDLDNARTAYEMCVKLSWLDVDYEEVRELAQRHLDELFSEGA